MNTNQARAFVNPAAHAPAATYQGCRLTQVGFDAALAEISNWPGYAATALLLLPGLASLFGVGQVLYKDERKRFGLGSSKALGGAYAVANVLRQRVMAACGLAQVSSRELLSGAFNDIIAQSTVTSATDGNHGRAVAWGAQLFGCPCVIYVHEHVSQGRRDAIARYGAEVREVKGNYDDAVKYAAATAAAEGWAVVSDTSYPGYCDIPLDVMHGYGVMAAAVCASFWLQWGERRPHFVVVEPTHADCVYRSLEAGHPVVVGGALDTVMAGLACGEVSELAWAVLLQGSNVSVAVDDAYALQAMRVFAAPAAADPPVVAGETGGVGLAALLAALQHPELRQAIGLNRSSRVLLIGSEGDTDPVIYREVVGRTAEEVLRHTLLELST